MKKKNPGGLLILNALAWAAAMLVTAHFMGVGANGFNAERLLVIHANAQSI